MHGLEESFFFSFEEIAFSVTRLNARGVRSGQEGQGREAAGLAAPRLRPRGPGRARRGLVWKLLLDPKRRRVRFCGRKLPLMTTWKKEEAVWHPNHVITPSAFEQHSTVLRGESPAAGKRSS